MNPPSFSAAVMLATVVSASSAIGVTVSVDFGNVRAKINPWIYGTGMEDVNHEIYGGLDAQRLFGESFEEPPPRNDYHGVSGQWRKAASEDGGDFAYDRKIRHWGNAAQVLEPRGGMCAIANAGLFGWGVPLRPDRPMRGWVWVRGTIGELSVELWQADDTVVAAAKLPAPVSNAWTRLTFELTPTKTDPRGQFAIRATGLGKVWVDDVYLADKPTNRFGELGCREDIVEGFRQQGLTFLRWGGCMANAAGYLLKNMPGERLPYHGFWYDQSSGGFGVREFVAMSAEYGAPCAFSINAAEDVNAAKQFAADLKRYSIPLFVEIGNEECISKKFTPEDYRRYSERCRTLAPAMKAVNPALKFVSAAWWRDNRLDLMEEHFRAVDGIIDYWDLHVWISHLPVPQGVLDTPKRVLKLCRTWNPKTTMKMAVFEENGNNHSLERALCHARMLAAAREMGDDLLTSCPANALQPHLHHDNWWDQGQVFFTPDKVWLQPCGYAQQMASANHRDTLVGGQTDDGAVTVSVTRNANAAGTAILHLVNAAAQAKPVAWVRADGKPVRIIKALTLTGPKLWGDNPPQDPARISPREITSSFATKPELPPHSYTVVEMEL